MGVIVQNKMAWFYGSQCSPLQCTHMQRISLHVKVVVTRKVSV